MTGVEHDWFVIRKAGEMWQVVRRTPLGVEREVVFEHPSALVARMEATNHTYRARRAAHPNGD